MLSRVANTLYWMARYVERADNLARLIDVNRHLLLDNETLGSDRIADFWRPIILCTGDEELFQSLYPETHGEDVIRFLTDDPRNVSSITSCIAQARESARTVRDQISDEMWEEINALHLFVRSDEAAYFLKEAPPRYYERIRRSVATFLGISATSHSRDEGWEFMQLGRHLERADKTTRFLDTTSYLPRRWPWQHRCPRHVALDGHPRFLRCAWRVSLRSSSLRCRRSTQLLGLFQKLSTLRALLRGSSGRMHSPHFRQSSR